MACFRGFKSNFGFDLFYNVDIHSALTSQVSVWQIYNEDEVKREMICALPKNCQNQKSNGLAMADNSCLRRRRICTNWGQFCTIGPGGVSPNPKFPYQKKLFGRIEWVPPLKTKKLLRVMRRTGKQRWGVLYQIALAKNMPLSSRHTPSLIRGGIKKMLFFFGKTPKGGSRRIRNFLIPKPH